MFMLARSKSNSLDVRRVPVILIPGIMGTRLELKPPGEVILWDPDDTTYMFSTWLFKNAEKKASWLHVKNPATVLDSAPGISDDESARGWAGLVQEYYLGMLSALESGLAGTIQQCPIYAYGYDWRQSNAVSGKGLRTFVDRVLVEADANVVILVTHSMGGMVARAGMQQDHRFKYHKVGGVIHIAQPVLGAPAAYRRLADGGREDFDGRAVAKLIGNAEDAAAIFSGIPAAIELLPHEGRRNHGRPAHTRWMFHHPPDEPDRRTEFPDVKLFEKTINIYKSVHYPPALFPEDSAYANDLLSLLGKAQGFTGKLVAAFHPITRVIAGKGRSTDTAAVFEFSDAGLPGCTYDVKAGRSDEGDATVPLWSAEALFPDEHHDLDEGLEPEIQRQWVVEGIDHDVMCDASNVQDATVEIIEAMLLPPSLANTGLISEGTGALVTLLKVYAGDRDLEMEIRVGKLLVEEGHSVMLLSNPDSGKTPDLRTDFGDIDVKHSAGTRAAVEDKFIQALKQHSGTAHAFVVRAANAIIPFSEYEDAARTARAAWFAEHGESSIICRALDESRLPPLWSPPPKDPR